ncbi:unnamed protein product, partial [Prorocentrum cordatum]
MPPPVTTPEFRVAKLVSCLKKHPADKDRLLARIEKGQALNIKGVQFTIEEMELALMQYNEWTDLPDDERPFHMGEAAGSGDAAPPGVLDFDHLQLALVPVPVAPPLPPPADPPPDDVAPATTTSDAAHPPQGLEWTDYELSALEGTLNVFRDRVEGRWFVALSTTCEWVKLEQTHNLSTFDVEFGLDGAPAIIFEVLPEGVDGDGHAWEVNHALGFISLEYTTKATNAKVLICKEANDYFGIYSLSEAVSRHTSHVVRMKTGVGGARVTLVVFRFGVKRKFANFYVVVKDVFNMLDLGRTTASGSVWAARYWPSWEKYLKKLGITSVEKSVQTEPDRKKHGDDPTRVLKWPSVSTEALFAMCCRWAFCSQQQGGFSQEKDQASAKLIIGTMMKIAMRGRSTIPLYFKNVRRTPFGQIIGDRGPFHVKIDGSSLDLSIFQKNRMRADGVEAVRFCTYLEKENINGQDIRIMTFLEAIAPSVHCMSTYSQICWRVGEYVENAISTSLDHGQRFDDFEASSPDDCNTSEAQVGHENALYLLGCKAHIDQCGVQFLSSATDKSRVRGMGLQNTAFATPDGVAWWAPTQCTQLLEDIADFTGHSTMASILSDAGGDAAPAQRDLQRAWLKRKLDESATFKPKKVRRKSAFQWLAALGNQVKSFSIDGGLQTYSQPEDISTREPALKWPRISAACDLGSDGVSALSYWIHQLRGCIDAIPDPSHGVHDDMCNSLKFAGLFDHLLSDVICINFANGPWSEDTHFKRMQQCPQDTFEASSPDKNALFQEMMNDMLADPSAKDIRGDEDCGQLLWDAIPESSPLVKRGGKAVMGRLMEINRRIRKELNDYNAKRFCALTTCLELDLLSSQAALKRLDAPADEKTANVKKNTDKVELDFARACLNQMAIAGISMLDPSCKRKDHIICQGTLHWDKWHSKQNAELRSCFVSADWIVSEPRSNFIDAMFAGWADLCNERVMKESGFHVPTTVAELNSFDPEDCDEDEDYLAFTLFHLNMGTTYYRSMRMGWLLLGPSSRSALLTRGGDDAKDAAAYIRRCRDQYDECINVVEHTPDLQAVVDRRVFKRVSEEQVYRVLKEADFTITQDVVDFSRKIHTKLIASQVDEDAFNVQKNMPKYKNRQGKMNMMQHRWLGGLMHDCVAVMARKKEAGDAASVPMLPCGCMPDSVVVMFPFKEMAIPNGGAVFAPVRPADPLDLYQAVVSLDDWEGCCITVQSPLTLRRSCGFGGDAGATDLGRIGLRKVDGHSFEHILKALARVAFNSVRLPVLQRLAAHLRVGVDPGAGLFGTLVALINNILNPISESAILDILAKRPTKMHSRVCDSIYDLLDFEDQLVCLDRGDFGKLQETRKRSEYSKEVLTDYIKEYAKMREKV